MTITYGGKCACGGVRVTIEGEPMGPYQCICRQCQHASGGGPATFVMAPQSQVKIDGEVTAFEEPTQSGNQASRSFCKTCGTAIFSEPAKSPGLYAVKLGVIDNPPWENVKAIFWTSEKPAWFHLEADVANFDAQP